MSNVGTELMSDQQKTLPERLRDASGGYEEWRVQHPDTGSYCMSFSRSEVAFPELSAREWLDHHKARHPDSVFAGYVVACVQVQTGADNLMQEAATEIERLQQGHDRYEVVRRMNVPQFADAYKSSVLTGKPFDQLIDELAPFYGLRVGP